MLQRLIIDHFVLIDHLDLKFNQGFSVFVGETGAGKSLIVDALQVLTGARISMSMIKKDCEKAKIEAFFEIDNSKVLKQLQLLGINSSKIKISKEFSVSKSIVKINDQLTTNSFLKKITPYLMDIHAQHNLHQFLDASTHLSLLDQLYAIDLTDYSLKYEEYKLLLSQKQAVLDNQDYDIDFLNFQLDEIMKVDPQLSEDDELLAIQKNYLQLQKQKNAVLNAFNTIDIQGIYELGQLLNNEKLLDCYYVVEEELSIINHQLSNDNEVDIDNIQERLFKIQALKKKYGPTLNDVLAKKEDLMMKIRSIDEKEFILAQLDQKIKLAYSECENLATQLTLKRLNGAKQLEKDLVEHLADLNFMYVEFKVHFNTVELNATGCDEIQFLISLNKGNDVYPIEQVASGGELSRILLALKTIFANKQAVDTLIFDEIDAGVSGKVALSIGKKMHHIAKSKQVLCISHLPSVVACADYQYRVLKSYDHHSTTSYISLMNEQQLIEELALLSSSIINEFSKENARQLLQLAKSEISNG